MSGSRALALTHGAHGRSTVHHGILGSVPYHTHLLLRKEVFSFFFCVSLFPPLFRECDGDYPCQALGALLRVLFRPPRTRARSPVVARGRWRLGVLQLLQLSGRRTPTSEVRPLAASSLLRICDASTRQLRREEMCTGAVSENFPHFSRRGWSLPARNNNSISTKRSVEG